MLLKCVFVTASSFSEKFFRIPAALAIFVWCLCTCDAGLTDPCSTDEPTATETPAAVEVPAAAKDSQTGRRLAIVLCGHPGDQDHIELFRGSVEKIRTGLTTHYQFLPENIHVFIGEDAAEGAADAGDAAAEKLEPANATASATSEVIASHLQTLKGQMTVDDRLFVIVIGHTYFENNHAWYNLHGPDIEQKEFATLFDGLPAKEQVFFITIPCSGYYIRTLSRPGRVIITATESDLEVNETLCPHVLADVLNSAPLAEWDLDSDKRVSLFEFYIALCRAVADRYIDETLISTEHAQLDDNGDGKGTELQQHYLTEDQGGLPKNRQRQQLVEGRDGMAASKINITSF